MRPARDSASSTSGTRGRRWNTQQDSNAETEQHCNRGETNNNTGRHMRDNEEGQRLRRRQERTGRHRRDLGYRGLQAKMSAYEKGRKEDVTNKPPSNEELMMAVNKE